MSLPIMTPLRTKFCDDIRRRFLIKYNAPLRCADFRILNSMALYRFKLPLNADSADILLDDLKDQHDNLKETKR